MAIPNYKDLLDLAGLQSWQFMLIVLIIMLLWPVVVIVYNTGLLGKVKVDRVVLPAFKCVYISYLGSYDDIGKIYSQAVEDFKMVFKFSNYFTILYDNPADQKSQEMSRAIIGLSLHTLQIGKADLFLSKFPQYKKGQFPQTQCLRSTLPLMELSPILAIARVYPAMDEKLQELNLVLKHKQILQFYHQNDQQTSLSVLVPIANEEAFQKWYEPTSYTTVHPKKRQ